MKKVLITGSTGYIGRELVRNLSHGPSCERILPVRRIENSVKESSEQILIEDIGKMPSSALTNVEVVVHLAGKAHDLSGSKDLADEFRRVNVEATAMLASQARSAGVRKFIFLSSIGVCGSATQDVAFTEHSVPRPLTDYAKSKLDAENAILEIVKGSSMEVVIIRPPLVYGAGAPGNFARLLRLVSLGIPLPFKDVDNRRSIVALENLVDFISHCIDQPSCGNTLFLISDGEDVSTEDIVRYLALGMGKRLFLFSVPKKAVRALASSLGKAQMYTQLFESLTIDCAKARETLQWVPRLAVKDALLQAGREYSHAS
jgi:nucleoside-diphosphate-sugar epimerase